MNVFVTGGTGYVGQPIVDELLQRGHRVTLLTREEDHADTWKSKVNVVVGDILDPTSLKLGLQDANAVIHLVGIIREHPRKGVTMDRIHIEGTAAIVSASRAVGIKRFIHMSALGARPDAFTAYHKSKWQAEKQIRQSGLPFTIFRPSVIFGRGGPGLTFVSQLIDVVQSTPFVPIIGSGEYPLQPVHVSVVASAFVDALTSSNTIGETFELGGPVIVNYEDVVRQIMTALNKQKPVMHIPLALMQTLVQSLSWLPRFPLSRDQLAMLIEGNTCASPSRVYNVFELEKIPFSVSLNDVSQK